MIHSIISTQQRLHLRPADDAAAEPLEQRPRHGPERLGVFRRFIRPEARRHLHQRAKEGGRASLAHLRRIVRRKLLEYHGDE